MAQAPRDPKIRSMRFEDHLSDTDTLMLELESDATLRSTILTAWVLDRAPDRTRFERKLERALSTELQKLRGRS